MKRIIALTLAGALTLGACADGSAPTTTLPAGAAVAEFATPDGHTFKVLLTGDAAEHARAAFAAGERPGIPNGAILPGDAGINIGHDWHLEEVEFAEVTVEVCDGNVSYIDEVGYEAWAAGSGGRYCPWGAELVGLEG